MAYKSGYDVPDTLPCGEISQFKEALAQARAIDDRIIYKLNTSIPTESFAGQINAADQCKHLYDELQHVYRKRETALQKCVVETSEKLAKTKEEWSQNDGNPDFTKKLRKEQTALRLMKSELAVEDVVKDRSLKVFKERCWQAYKPDDL